jgi:hypothetical protein
MSRMRIELKTYRISKSLNTKWARAAANAPRASARGVPRVRRVRRPCGLLLRAVRRHALLHCALPAQGLGRPPPERLPQPRQVINGQHFNLYNTTTVCFQLHCFDLEHKRNDL